jgi:hypothetical protein
MIPVIVVAAAFVAAGFAMARWPVVVIAAALVPFYFAGLVAGWWGSGVGDGWQFALAIGTAASTVGALVGVATRRLVNHREPRYRNSRALWSRKK